MEENALKVEARSSEAHAGIFIVCQFWVGWCRTVQTQILKDLLTHVCGLPVRKSGAPADRNTNSDASGGLGDGGSDDADGPGEDLAIITPDNMDTQISIDMVEAVVAEDTSVEVAAAASGAVDLTEPEHDGEPIDVETSLDVEGLAMVSEASASAKDPAVEEAVADANEAEASGFQDSGKPQGLEQKPRCPRTVTEMEIMLSARLGMSLMAQRPSRQARSKGTTMTVELRMSLMGLSHVGLSRFRRQAISPHH